MGVGNPHLVRVHFTPKRTFLLPLLFDSSHLGHILEKSDGVTLQSVGHDTNADASVCAANYVNLQANFPFSPASKRSVAVNGSYECAVN